MNMNSILANLDRDNFHFEMTSLCGCSFSATATATASAEQTVLALVSHDTMHYRTVKGVSPEALMEVLSFLSDAMLAFAQATDGADVPLVHEAYFEPFGWR